MKKLTANISGYNDLGNHDPQRNNKFESFESLFSNDHLMNMSDDERRSLAQRILTFNRDKTDQSKLLQQKDLSRWSDDSTTNKYICDSESTRRDGFDNHVIREALISKHTDILDYQELKKTSTLSSFYGVERSPPINKCDTLKSSEESDSVIQHNHSTSTFDSRNLSKQCTQNTMSKDKSNQIMNKESQTLQISKTKTKKENRIILNKLQQIKQRACQLNSVQIQSSKLKDRLKKTFNQIKEKNSRLVRDKSKDPFYNFYKKNKSIGQINIAQHRKSKSIILRERTHNTRKSISNLNNIENQKYTRIKLAHYQKNRKITSSNQINKENCCQQALLNNQNNLDVKKEHKIDYLNTKLLKKNESNPVSKEEVGRGNIESKRTSHSLIQNNSLQSSTDGIIQSDIVVFHDPNEAYQKQSKMNLSSFYSSIPSRETESLPKEESNDNPVDISKKSLGSVIFENTNPSNKTKSQKDTNNNRMYSFEEQIDMIPADIIKKAMIHAISTNIELRKPPFYMDEASKKYRGMRDQQKNRQSSNFKYHLRQ